MRRLVLPAIFAPRNTRLSVKASLLALPVFWLCYVYWQAI